MDVLRIVMRDVNNGMSAHDLYTQRFDQVVDARNEEQIAYELNQKLYQRGINSYFQLLESRVQLDYLNLEVNQAQLEQFITIVNLYQDLAGGYKV
jgi:outer membrane protein TolC